MRDGEFHLNVLKRIEELENTSASTFMVRELDNKITELETKVEDLEGKVIQLESEIETLRDDMRDVVR